MEITYNKIEELTGKPYRSIKKHFDALGVQSLRRSGNKVFFESKDVLELKSSSQDKSNEDWTNLLEEEKYRKLKRENDIEDQLVAPTSLLTEAIEQLAAQVIPILDAMPMKMKRANPSLSGHDIMLVKKSVAECRNIIAKVKVMEIDD